MIRAALLLLAPLAASCLSATAAPARDCRPPADAPPGVRVPPLPGCAATAPRPQAPAGEALRAERRDGFIDLGGGSSVRIGGRVRVDAVGRR
jgi:hypothetical protein